ncbi:MAG: hypothetical protein Q9190_004349 [Brigantiaea leucoxantha]
MAPQTDIPVAANVLGTIGTVLWCIQLIPQIWYNWRQKKTDGLPGIMMFTWALSAAPFGVYAVVQNFSIALQVQPQAFCALSLISWCQILIYNHSFRPLRAALLAILFAALFAGLQALLILTLRGPYRHGVSYPIITVGIIAAILLAAGLIPPYFELWKRSGRVVGINFVFLSIDFLGAFFSLMALVAQREFDALGGVLYIVCLVLEAGIFASQAVFLVRSRKLRRSAKEMGVDFDEVEGAEKYVFPRPAKEAEAEEGKVGAVVVLDVEGGGGGAAVAESNTASGEERGNDKTNVTQEIREV